MLLNTGDAITLIGLSRPGVVQHGLFGWIARRDGEKLARGRSHIALLARLPYCDDWAPAAGPGLVLQRRSVMVSGVAA